MYFVRDQIFICVFIIIINGEATTSAYCASCHNFQVPLEDDILTYDFIIVGGGTSGCAVAGRLSEKYSVLLVNDGGRPGDELDIPALAMSSVSNPQYTKVYKSVPQANAGLGNENSQIDFMIARVLGGGSSVNGMIYNKGSPYGYDTWANITNDPSWEYKNLLKYFRRMEDYNGSFPSDYNHGIGGPIPVSMSNYAPGLEEWMEAGEYLGYPSWLDPNGPQVPGFAVNEFTKRHGRRVSSFAGYVKPFLKTRPNLNVVTQAEVKRILFNDKNDHAIGVTYSKTRKDGSTGTLQAFARKEVIVSAGVMDSPAILMRSGIGPVDVLSNCEIPVVKILPVGYNLHDHVGVLIYVHIKKRKSDVLIPERDLNPESWAIFEETGDGPYSSMVGAHGQAFLVSSVRRQEQGLQAAWADTHFTHGQSSQYAWPGFRVQPSKEYVSIFDSAVLVRPKSRGRVTLNISDVDAMPLIDFQYLSHPDDLSVLLEGVKFIVNMYENTPSFQKQGAQYPTEPYGPCRNSTFRSDDYWRCFIRHLTISGLHAGGTCRMGAGEDDPNAVVDSQLKVIGIEGLRVVDASIMPNVINANTQSAAYVIAEKASDMILNEWSTTPGWGR